MAAATTEVRGKGNGRIYGCKGLWQQQQQQWLNNADKDADANNNKDSTNEDNNKENNWGKDGGSSRCRRRCQSKDLPSCPAAHPPQWGAAAIVVFVNNVGILSSKMPMATVVHVSAGQKEEALADNC
jgi:hypothetical protein